MDYRLLALFMILAVLAGCSETVEDNCIPPLVNIRGECCMDADNDSICDAETTTTVAEPPVDIPEEEPIELIELSDEPVIRRTTQQIIVNSRDLKEYYSVNLYANLLNVPVRTVLREDQSTSILQGFGKYKPMALATSENVPVIEGYYDLIKSKGFNVNEVILKDINLQLAKDIGDVDYIIISGDNPKDAAVVAPYAVYTRSYVIFADKSNINTVKDIILNKPGDIIIYSDVDQEVIDALSEFGPEVINEGDVYMNNVEIVRKFIALHDKKYGGTFPLKRFILTDGKYMDEEIFKGEYPALLIRRGNVPEEIMPVLLEADYVTLVGDDLFSTVQDLNLGLTIYNKYTGEQLQSSAFPVK